MRLDKLRIGSDKPPIDGIDKHRFKNLKDVTIDFDEDEWITVVIGWNGTGKSNVLEAITHLFCELSMDAEMPSRTSAISFSYELTYFCHGKKITIKADPDKPSKDIYDISFVDLVVSGKQESGKSLALFNSSLEQYEKVSYPRFRKNSGDFLPKFLFGYYSGQSRRLEEAFSPYLKRYDEKLRGGKNPGLRQLFYALPDHSQFVLLAFMQSEIDAKDVVVSRFLEKEIGLDPEAGFDSVLFVIKQPSWDRNPKLKKEAKQNGIEFKPDIFWGAEGVVRNFLDRLLDISLAPLVHTRKVKDTLWGKGNDTEFVYLYVKDLDALAKLRGSQTGREFFRELESTYVSELIEEIRIRIKLKKNDGTVIFYELSEGERQLLTVLGLLRFTAEEESLFLLDEPDTHLNPKWSVDYIKYLNEFVSSNSRENSTSHIVLTTHNPIAIAELNKQQVQILHRDPEYLTITAHLPKYEPRGMGYTGIVTSDMFGLPSSLDKRTQRRLEIYRMLSSIKKRTHFQELRYQVIQQWLDDDRFKLNQRDDDYQRYLEIRSDLLTKEADTEDYQQLIKYALSLPSDERARIASEAVNAMLAEEK